MPFKNNSWSQVIEHKELKNLQVFKFQPGSYPDLWICIRFEATEETPEIMGFALYEAFKRQRFTVNQFAHNDRVYITD